MENCSFSSRSWPCFGQMAQGSLRCLLCAGCCYMWFTRHSIAEALCNPICLEKPRSGRSRIPQNWCYAQIPTHSHTYQSAEYCLSKLAHIGVSQDYFCTFPVLNKFLNMLNVIYTWLWVEVFYILDVVLFYKVNYINIKKLWLLFTCTWTLVWCNFLFCTRPTAFPFRFQRAKAKRQGSLSF